MTYLADDALSTVVKQLGSQDSAYQVAYVRWQVQSVCYTCVHKSKSGMMTMHVKKSLTVLFVQLAFDICLLSIRKGFHNKRADETRHSVAYKLKRTGTFVVLHCSRMICFC